MPLDIREFELDDENEAKAARHGVRAVELLQVLDNPFRVFTNRRDRSATHLLIGLTHGGRTITMPIESTHVDGRWRPVTAWPASEAEKARYER